MNEVKSDRKFSTEVDNEVDTMLIKATQLKDKIFKESVQIINS